MQVSDSNAPSSLDPLDESLNGDFGYIRSNWIGAQLYCVYFGHHIVPELVLKLSSRIAFVSVQPMEYWYNISAH